MKRYRVRVSGSIEVVAGNAADALLLVQDMVGELSGAIDYSESIEDEDSEPGVTP